MLVSPAFGEADLTNCERELIQLAGSVQPHVVLLVLSEPEWRVVQASANCITLIGTAPEDLLHKTLAVLGGDLERRTSELAAAVDLSEPAALAGQIQIGAATRSVEGTLHRHAGGGLILEFEVVPNDMHVDTARPETVQSDPQRLRQSVASAVQRFSAAANLGALADATVQCVRDLTGYDRVMVYKFDPDGHGKIIAEARHPRLETLLGHHYPATDIPQRARELYIRTRVRVLVDVHYTPAPLVPRRHPPSGSELDMSLCYSRSMSPLHLQYLKNMGVTATLVVSLVREGRLWGLISCHHYAPRNVRYPVRTAMALLAEVIATRVAAIENYAHAQVAILVRQLEQRLIDATSTEGDWRLALLRNPRNLLQPLDATGAALFYEGDVLTSGEVPSTPELRALAQHVDGAARNGLFSTASIARDQPALGSLTAIASGVLAVKLSESRPDFLMWFRKEQLSTVTWAGDPSKPMVRDNPLELSPRRSFAAWSEIVRGTASPWTGAEISLARAIGDSLIDIIVQVHAVRLLIAEHQLARVRATLASAKEPVVVADARGNVLFTNPACHALVAVDREAAQLSDVANCFTDSHEAVGIFQRLIEQRQVWRGELTLARGGDDALPVSVRTEIVPGPDGAVLGFIVIMIDQSARKRADAARRQLEQSLSVAAGRVGARPRGVAGGPAQDDVMSAIVAASSLAALDIADTANGRVVAPLLEELEASTLRAAMLYRQIFPGGES